ncbi:hypothetical protein CCACVL1_03472, partial [Corchorus capsularis]
MVFKQFRGSVRDRGVKRGQLVKFQ